MGQMRFQVPHPERIPDEALQRTYLAGMEGIPWRGHNTWIENTGAKPSEFVVERPVDESGNLYFPWSAAGRGELILSTASLMERQEPYNLVVELARGQVNRLRNQAADWELAGLLVPEAFVKQLKQASDLLIDAVISTTDPDEVANKAEQAIELGLNAGDLLVDEYTRQALAARHQQSPQLPTMFGSALDSRTLGEGESEAYLAALNATSMVFRWRDIEPSAGKFNWQPFDQQIDWCRGHGLRIVGGPLLQTERHPSQQPGCVCTVQVFSVAAAHQVRAGCSHRLQFVVFCR